MIRPQPSLLLSSQGAWVHFAVAIALVTVLPALTLIHLHGVTDTTHPLTTAQWVAAGLGIAGGMIFGYILLGRYPATIIRLRTCLRNVVNGELPDAIHLAAPEHDIMAIEDALNVVLAMLRKRLHNAEAQKERLEDELFQSQKLEAIGTLAAGIAHEISTPLQFVSNNAQFLSKACRSLLEPDPTTGDARSTAENALAQQAFLRGEAPRAYAQLEEGIARISEIVSAIRDFAKAPPDETRAVIDLHAAARSVLEVSRNEWKYAADLETGFDPTLPLVPCYPAEIRQALTNLIVNAAQAIVAKGPRADGRKGLIRIATRRHGNEVQLSVTDDGCGIPAAIRDRIFDPFFTTREVGTGKGCGLAFVQASVVKRHGGRIHVESAVGRGSTFTMGLPLAVEPTGGTHPTGACKRVPGAGAEALTAPTRRST